MKNSEFMALANEGREIGVQNARLHQMITNLLCDAQDRDYKRRVVYDVLVSQGLEGVIAHFPRVAEHAKTIQLSFAVSASFRILPFEKYDRPARDPFDSW